MSSASDDEDDPVARAANTPAPTLARLEPVPLRRPRARARRTGGRPRRSLLSEFNEVTSGSADEQPASPGDDLDSLGVSRGQNPGAQNPDYAVERELAEINDGDDSDSTVGIEDDHVHVESDPWQGLEFSDSN